MEKASATSKSPKHLTNGRLMRQSRTAPAAAASRGSAAGNGAGQDWRTLQETPAGRLLSALYGNSKPLIDYPVVSNNRHSSANKVRHDKPFIPGGGKPDVDVRAGEKKVANVPVPRFGKPRRMSPPAPVCFLPRRKSAAVIESELREIDFQRVHYRPPVSHALSTDKEKKRLNELFTHKGGKALPAELLHPVGPTPTELAEARKREKALREKRIKAGLEQPLAPPKQPDLFDMVVQEIEDRANHLDEMADLAGGHMDHDLLARTRGEISHRMRELQKLDETRYREMQDKVSNM